MSPEEERLVRGVIGDERDTVGAEDGSGLCGIEPALSYGERGCDRTPRGGVIWAKLIRPGRRRFHQQL
jgi:hypothetical protein